MRALLAAAALFVGAAAPASTTAELMVPPPEGFTVLAPPAGVEGPVTTEMIGRLNGDKATKGVSAQELKDALADSYARSFVNQSTRDALVIFGYHLRSDGEAVGFVRGALNSAESDQRFKTLAGAPAGVAVFSVTDAARGTNGEMSLVRQGRYVYQFLVVAGSGSTAPPAGLALRLARDQQAKLPAGSRSFQESGGGLSLWAIVLVGVAVGALVLAVVARRGRRSDPHDPPGPPPGPSLDG